MRYNITKFLILIICCYMLVLACNTSEQFSLARIFPNDTINHYSREMVIGGENYNCAGLFCNTSTSRNTHIVGESVEIDSDKIYIYLSKLKAKAMRIEYVQDLGMTIIYAFSPLIKTQCNDSNIQLAIRGEKATLGWPMIYGSF